MNNVRAEGGSKIFSLKESPRAKLTNVIAKNPRGPNPSGQCFQLGMSHGTSVENFYCIAEQGKSWTGDTISAWRTSDATFKHGLVDGNNSDRGFCMMFEGSDAAVSGGLVEDVDAIHC